MHGGRWEEPWAVQMSVGAASSSFRIIPFSSCSGRSWVLGTTTRSIAWSLLSSFSLGNRMFYLVALSQIQVFNQWPDSRSLDKSSTFLCRRHTVTKETIKKENKAQQQSFNCNSTNCKHLNGIHSLLSLLPMFSFAIPYYCLF